VNCTDVTSRFGSTMESPDFKNISPLWHKVFKCDNDAAGETV
jgi:hypothetical protein